MKMNKIEALKKTLGELNDPEGHYEWHEVQSCNCGRLAQCVTGLNNHELYLKTRGVNEWSFAIQGKMEFEMCKVTGMPINEIFKALYSAGFTGKDIMNLEYLRAKDVCKKLGWKHQNEKDTHDENLNRVPGNRYQGDKENVIAYITAWIEILKEEETPTVSIQEKKEPKEEVKEVIEYVPVMMDEKVKSLVKEELILN